MIRNAQTVRKVNSHGHRPIRESAEMSKINFLQKQPLNELFPQHALVVNLKRCEDRLKMFQANNKFEGTTEIIEAIDGLEIEQPKVAWMKRGDLATLRSHKKALQCAKDKGWECVLIFEDDISQPVGFNATLKQCMSELPYNWDCLWMGGAMRTKSYDYSPRLKLMTGRWGCFAMVIRNTMYDFLIGEYSKEEQSSDTYCSAYHAQFNSFETNPLLITHIGHVSERVKVNQHSDK